MIQYPVELVHAFFSYGEKHVLEDVTLRIRAGEIFCLMGRNGCGKSTLLDAVLGINPVEKGSVQIMGSPISSYRPAALAKHISYVPQMHEKSFPYTVKQVILMGRTVYAGNFGLYGSEDYEIVKRTMEETGIAALADRPYTQLSGGEMQMVMLARALVQETEIILMDEPTAHLDYYNELLFLETVIRLVRERGKTVVMATHSPNQAFFIEKAGVPVRAGLMRDGGIRTEGLPSEVLNPDTIRETYAIESEILKTGSRNVLLPKQTVKTDEK